MSIKPLSSRKAWLFLNIKQRVLDRIALTEQCHRVGNELRAVLRIIQNVHARTSVSAQYIEVEHGNEEHLHYRKNKNASVHNDR